LTVTVPESAIAAAVERGLLESEDHVEPWTVIQGCYPALLSDLALDWLIDGGVIKHVPAHRFATRPNPMGYRIACPAPAM
jgi:hypothetical protein